MSKAMLELVKGTKIEVVGDSPKDALEKLIDYFDAHQMVVQEMREKIASKPKEGGE